MAAPNILNVVSGGPEQTATTGAISRAPLGTPLPTSTRTPLDTHFTSTGYVNEDGVAVSVDRSQEQTKEWGGSVVKSTTTEVSGVISWTNLELNAEVLKQWFGAANVIRHPATAERGEMLEARLTNKDLPIESYVFNMLDGNSRTRLVAPRAQVTKAGEIKFEKKSAIQLPVELTCFPDDNGVCLYLYTDNGVFTVTPTP